MPDATRVDGSLPRNAEAYRCECGGYAEHVPCTGAERREVGCGRGWDCCSAAFVCGVCGRRYYAALEAPEME